MADNTVVDENHPKHLIPTICSEMYAKGWATGSGGGFSMRYNDELWVAPSGVQKEKIKPNDLFVLDSKGNVIREPGVLKLSECTPLFLNAYLMRAAGAVLHSHSQNAVLATFLFKDRFTITGIEMIKGIKKGQGAPLNNTDMLIVPIIENTEREIELTESMGKAMQEYPDTNAVLVRGHGVYIWGPTWEKAKMMAECYDYLFEMSIKLQHLGKLSSFVNTSDLQ